MTPTDPTAQDLEATMRRLGEDARQAAQVLALAPTATKDRALAEIAAALRAQMPRLLAANLQDMEAGRAKGLSAAMLDRLKLDDGRIEAMARGVEEITAQPDPVGQVIGRWTRPNGLEISRVRVPLGVIGIIFESRPNVTVDASALCLKSGNAAILRGGSESFHSAGAIMACVQAGLKAAGLPEACVQMVPTRDRAAVGLMLRMTEYLDVIVPRGGKSLIQRVSDESRVPLFKHLEGLCHTYLHADADPSMAHDVTLNAKMRRTGICGATETLLVDRAAAATLLPPIIDDLIQAGCEVRGDEAVRALDSRVQAATEQDWRTEYLDAILSVRVVDGVAAAIDHIRRYGSGHTESIITNDAAAAETFLNGVDSAIVLHNASTQFADGGEFGMGAEIGISTGKLHARGPVGVEQLTSFKYMVRGSGQTRS